MYSLLLSFLYKLEFRVSSSTLLGSKVEKKHINIKKHIDIIDIFQHLEERKLFLSSEGRYGKQRILHYPHNRV